jgi:uridine kinase
MRVAILLSGYLRVYENVLNFINTQIKPNFTECDVFLHITKNENTEDKYLNLIDEDSDIKKFVSEINPKSIIIESNQIFLNKPTQNSTVNQWFKLNKLNQIKKTYETLYDKKYDLVIRLRPDLDIKDTKIFSLKLDSNVIYIPKDSKIDKNKLHHLTDGYLCDAIAFGSSDMMDKYFDIFDNIIENTIECGGVSETLLFNHLNRNKINYREIDIDYSFTLSKCNIFAICGDSGSGKSTLSNILKNHFTEAFSLECDRYHKWERGNENWVLTTHLNPNANFIEKMKEDVFNLKIGKEVYQVDYDHSSGKFTEKKQIDPSNNLIVCGLHTIYDEKINSLYDLKIFMEPQKELRHKWKIIRDVTERGYDIEKVIDSIRKREPDYEKFILPQKNNADIIVNFFSKNTVNIYDINHKDDIGLKLSVSNHRNNAKIIQILERNKISFEYTMDKNRTTFVFNEYTDISKEIFSKKNFYDYIVLFIFNL